MSLLTYLLFSILYVYAIPDSLCRHEKYSPWYEQKRPRIGTKRSHYTGKFLHRHENYTG